MDVFEYAKEMEREGIKLYNEALSLTVDTGLQNILIMLINQEKKHLELFEYMQKSSDANLTKASFDGVKSLFAGLKAKKLVLVNPHIEFYKKILKVELDSEKTYREMAEKFEGEVKEQILTIAQEEKQHAVIIDNLLELVSHPETWVEDAEFNHLEEY